MPTGPCMCGDPYCGSCGSSSAGVMEAAEEGLMEALASNKAHIGVYAILKDIVPALCAAFNREVDAAVDEAAVGYQMEIDYLKDEITRLKEQLHAKTTL